MIGQIGWSSPGIWEFGSVGIDLSYPEINRLTRNISDLRTIDSDDAVDPARARACAASQPANRYAHLDQLRGMRGADLISTCVRHRHNDPRNRVPRLRFRSLSPRPVD